MYAIDLTYFFVFLGLVERQKLILPAPEHTYTHTYAHITGVTKLHLGSAAAAGSETVSSAAGGDAVGV